jgi:hypothetical protein
MYRFRTGTDYIPCSCNAPHDSRCTIPKENKDTEWVSILPKIIEQYNNTSHTALDNITPNQAISDPKKREHVMHLNIVKAQQNGFVTDLKPGDKVRVDDTALF